MKILHTESSRGWGGQELRILAEAEGMARRGHRAWIAAAPESRVAREAAARGVAVVPIGFRRPWGLADAIRLAAVIRRLGVELLNTHSSWDSWMGGVAGRLAGRGVGIVRTRHLSTPVGANPAARLLYTRLADHVVTTGEAIREALVRENGLSPDRVTSVATGVNPSRLVPTTPPAEVRARLGLPPAGAVAGTLSTIRSWKGHMDFLEAVALLRIRRDVRGLVVGDGPFAGAIRQRIAALRLEGLVVMAGQREDVADLLAAMDVLVQPSTANEGVPQAVLQALYLARPVVATRCGGIPEVVRDNQTGLLVPPRDAGALAGALARALDEKPAAESWGAAGRELVCRAYTLEATLDGMEEVYRRVRGESNGIRNT